MTTTYSLLNRLNDNLVAMNDESASDEARNAAAFAFDKNMAEVERLANAGDDVAQRYLDEQSAEWNADMLVFEHERGEVLEANSREERLFAAGFDTWDEVRGIN